jgi:salicylate hydroxylase
MATTHPLNIVIVGAGLGGTIAAYCLAHHGHTVRVLERKATLTTQGGGIIIRPNASRFLQRWGLTEYLQPICDESKSTFFRSAATDDVLWTRRVANHSEYPDWGIVRGSALELFAERAMEAGAEFGFVTTVVHFVEDEDEGVKLILSDGELLETDLVLLADGVGSRLRSKVLGRFPETIEPDVKDSLLYQIAVPEKEVLADEMAKSLVDHPDLTLWVMDGGFVVGRFHSQHRDYLAIFCNSNDRSGSGSLWEAVCLRPLLLSTLSTANGCSCRVVTLKPSERFLKGVTRD